MAAYAIRHPWFNMPSKKRKRPPSPSSEGDECPERFRTFEGELPKRRRCSTLEQGFAHLNLSHSMQTHVSSTSTSPNPSILELDVPFVRSPSPNAMESDYTYPIIQPTFIEEPTSPDISVYPPRSAEGESEEVADVKMRSESWYEPEKDRKCCCSLIRLLLYLAGNTGIVITDLDDSDEEGGPNSTSDSSGLTISNALLNRLRNQQPERHALPLPSAKPSSALVLFRPLSVPSKELEGEEVQEATVPTLASRDDDAMDVEL